MFAYILRINSTYPYQPKIESLEPSTTRGALTPPAGDYAQKIIVALVLYRAKVAIVTFSSCRIAGSKEWHRPCD